MAHKKQTIRLTEAQRRAVETVGRDVLVTASAGTGKTAALSLRCVERICDPERPVDADRLLVLTFTDAAAEEMRARIGQTLRQAARQQCNGRLRQQAMLLDGAYISTIHAFCKRTLTEFFHAAGVDPAFGILDADEQRLLKSEVLVETLEAAWREPQLGEALRTLFAGRRTQPGTGSFVDRIIPLSAFLDSVAGREAFYERARRINDAQDDAYAALLRQQGQIVCEMLERIRQRLEYALALDAHFCGGAFISNRIRQTYLPEIETCGILAKQGRLDRCAESIKNADFGRFPNKPKALDKEIAEYIKSPAAKAKEDFAALAQFAVLNKAYDAQLAGAVTLQSRTLLELLGRFDEAYTAAKGSRKVLDFADLEHRTLLLLEKDASAAAVLRERFEFVFVDEYQDINMVQQRILDALSRGDNVFAVGDVKQSIYAFRQSRPEIFLGRLATATDQLRDTDKPLRVDMRENFRSRREVLEFVNAVFGRIMTEGAAGMHYDERATLKAQFDYAPFTAGHPVELYILDEDSDRENTEDEESNEADTNGGDESPTEIIDATQRQAAFIARRIRQMVGADSGNAEFTVYDRSTGGYRDVRYGDIVILMRSQSHKANTYVEMLRLAQIPVNAQSACGYFETTEITDCVNLLKTLDNPCGDIELAATLRSPLFGFDDTGLAKIRFFTHDGSATQIPFYRAAVQYAQSGPDEDLRKTLGSALGRLEKWRQAAQRGSLAAMLDDVFRQTRLLSFYAALPNGSVRRANLLKLLDRAIQFEQFRTSRPGMGLARFVEFLEKLRQEEQDWAPGQPDSLEDAVRIMSVHKSKGLEFPVVFAAELNTPFNLSDERGECLINEETIGLQIAVEGGRFRLSSPAHQVLAERKRRQTTAEEMRILYVMLTRAREKLILTASRKEKYCRQRLIECALMRDTVTDWKLMEARSHLDWVLAALADEATLHRLYATGFEEAVKERNLFFADRIGRQQLDTLTEAMLKSKRSLKSVTEKPMLSAKQEAGYSAAFAKLEATLGQRYPFEESCSLCAKYSVSALTHRDDEFSTVDVSGAFEAMPSAAMSAPASGDGVDRRLTGSATHLVFEHLPLNGSITAETVRQTLEGLVREGIISETIARHIDSEGIAAYFATEPGQIALSERNNILREWPFTFGVDAAELGAAQAGETVIVQGIVDLIISTDQGLITADFKTDRITDEAALQNRIARYRQPLGWYARAASAILKQPVISSWLYFCDCRKAVQVS